MPTRTDDRLTPAGQRVLDAASALFYDQGIHAVGVDAIARRAGVTKKTLYDCFGSKDALVAAYLRVRDQRWREWLTSFVDRRADRPAARVLATFDALREWLRRESPRGCGFVNALAELPDTDHPGRAVILAQKRWMVGYFTDLAKAAGRPQPAQLARALMVLFEGATVADSTGVPTGAVRQAQRLAAGLFED